MSSQAFEILSETADITKCPSSRNESLVGSIAIGDLQGNALRLLYTLIREGILDVKPENDRDQAYQSFVSIYIGAQKLIQENFAGICKRFIDTSGGQKSQVNSGAKNRSSQLICVDIAQRYKKILTDFASNLALWQVINTKVLIRFLGNELASEGAFDGFTLAILGLLHNAQVRTVHYASPNGMAFVTAAERGFGEINDRIVTAENKPSLVALLFCFKYIKKADFPILKELQRNYEKVYLSRLNILGCTQNPDGSIVVYSHAPIPFITLEALAKRFDVKYEDSSASQLADTIDAINEAYRQYLIEAAPVDIEDDFLDYNNARLRATTFCKLLEKTSAYPIVSCMENTIPITPPEKDRDTTEQYSDWTRTYFTIPDRLRYPVYFVHSHTQWPERLAKPAHIYGLNRDFGRYSPISSDAESKRFESIHTYGKQAMDYAVLHHKTNSSYEKQYRLAKGIANAALVSLSGIAGAFVAGVSLYIYAPAILLAPFVGTILVGAVVGLCMGILLYCAVRFFTGSRGLQNPKNESKPIAVKYHTQTDTESSLRDSLCSSTRSISSSSPRFFNASAENREASSSSQIYDSDTDEPSIIKPKS